MKEKLKETIKRLERPITYLWKSLKILIFLSFVYTAIVMIKIRSANTAILIIFAVSFFLIFNKIDSMNKRIKKLEGKNGTKM